MSHVMTVCFKIDDKQHCIQIPVAAIQNWGPRPPNDDPRHWLQDWLTAADPEPEPWKVDLPVLATIDRLVGHLSDAQVRQQLEQVVQRAVKQVARTLPDGMEVELATQSQHQ